MNEEELNAQYIIDIMKMLKNRSLKNLCRSIKCRKLYDKDLAEMVRINNLLEEINNS